MKNEDTKIEQPGSEQELDREARAMIRRIEDGIDGLDWARRVLARSLQIQRLQQEPPR